MRSPQQTDIVGSLHCWAGVELARRHVRSSECKAIARYRHARKIRNYGRHVRHAQCGPGIKGGGNFLNPGSGDGRTERAHRAAADQVSISQSERLVDIQGLARRRCASRQRFARRPARTRLHAHRGTRLRSCRHPSCGIRRAPNSGRRRGPWPPRALYSNPSDERSRAGYDVQLRRVPARREHIRIVPREVLLDLRGPLQDQRASADDKYAAAYALARDTAGGVARQGRVQRDRVVA